MELSAKGDTIVRRIVTATGCAPNVASTAWHEAAHTIVGAAFGLLPCRAEVLVSADGSTTGMANNCGDGCDCPNISGTYSSEEILDFLGIESFPTDGSGVGFEFQSPCVGT